MSNTYQISISSNAPAKEGGKTADVVQPIPASSAQAMRLLAQSGATYTLTNQSTGKAPQQIHTKRRGKDLLIQIDAYRPDDSADLILENYFEQAPGPFTGIAEDDISYRFIPNTALPQHQISELTDGASITQVLGGLPFFVASPLLGVAGLGGAVAGLGGLGAGAAALAVAAALGGGGGGGSGGGAGTGGNTGGETGGGTGTTVNPTPVSKVPLESALKPADNTGLTTDTQTSKPKPVIEGKTAPGNKVFVTLDNGVEQEITPINADGSWTWTPPANLSEGEHTVKVKATDPKDPTGTPAEKLVTLLIDTSPLGIQIGTPASLDAALTDGVLNTAELGGASPEIPVTLKLNDTPIRDLTVDDLTVTGGSIKPGSFKKISPTEYAVSVLPPPSPTSDTGTIAVSLKTNPSPALTDDAGNPLGTVTPKTFNYDNKAPTASITSNLADLDQGAKDNTLNSTELTNGVTFAITLDSIPNRPLTLADLVLTGGTLANTLTRVSDTQYTVKAQPTADTNGGQLQLSLRAATGTTLSDVALNPLAPSISPLINYDTKAIGVVITNNREALDQGLVKDGVLNNAELASGPTTSGVTFTLTLDNAPTRNIVAADLVFAGGSLIAGSLSKVSETVYTVRAQPTADTNSGKLKLSLQPATPLTDASGNPAPGASSADISYDTKALSVTSITSNLAALDTLNNSVLSIAELAGGGVTFKIILDSAPQRDLGTGDLSVGAGGSLGSLTKVNATEYTAVVLPSPNLPSNNTGVLKFSIQASATNPLTDAAGNPLAAANSDPISFDNKAPVVALFSESIKDLPFNANFPITANTTDNDLSSMTASFLGSSKTLSRASNASAAWQFELTQAGLTDVANGYYTFKLTSTDTAGNSTDTLQIFKLNRGYLPTLWQGAAPTGDGSDNLFINTNGNQSFQGNGSADTFVWLSRDAGKPGASDTDTIADFSLAGAPQGDRLNLRDLLGGVAASDLQKYLKISAIDTNVDTDTLPDAVQVAISRLGQFTLTGDAAQADQLIVLSNLALPAATNLLALAEALHIDWNTTLSQPLFG